MRELVDNTIAPTYKYLEDEPKLVVVAAVPEHKQGKFDAQVDTLISLGDATLRSAATVDINVKSGSVAGMVLGAALVLGAGIGLGVSSAWPLFGTLALLCAFAVRWLLVHRPRTAAV